MRSQPERKPITRVQWLRSSVVLLASVFGYLLTLIVFYPGIMTYDARYVYNDIAKGFFGDWQSPVMTFLWSLIDPIAPGSGSMFLLIATLYWLAFAMIAFTVARGSWFATALPLAALAPPAFVFVGIIWRDVLFASAWLLAAALVFTVDPRTAAGRRWLLQGFAFVFLIFGVLLRPNALPAAPILAVFILSPLRWQFRRIAILYLPILFVLTACVPTIYYGVLHATRQHPLHSIIVFDLGGITHFTKENQFPGPWTQSETELLIERCYQPTEWGFYWNQEPCRFVMERLEGEKIFGSSQLVASWWHAVIGHPVAYLRHRAMFMTTFLVGMNFTMWTQDLDDPTRVVFADNPAFMVLKALHDALRSTPLFRPSAWFLLCIGVCALGWRQRKTPVGAFVLGVCGSAVVYVATFFFLGVASDFRYAYWAALAGLAGGIVLLPRPSAHT